MTIAELRALLAKAFTPVKWSSFETMVYAGNRNVVMDSMSDEEAALIAAAVNALPALLDVAEAAREYTACFEHAENCCFEWCQGCKDGHRAADRMATALTRLRTNDPGDGK